MLHFENYSIVKQKGVNGFFAANDCDILAAYINLFRYTQLLHKCINYKTNDILGDSDLLQPRFCEKSGYNGLPTSGISVTVKARPLIFLHVCGVQNPREYC